MVVDTSALVAILFGESEAERFAHALGEAPARLLSAVTRVELSFVVEGRKGETGRADLELRPDRYSPRFALARSMTRQHALKRSLNRYASARSTARSCRTPDR